MTSDNELRIRGKIQFFYEEQMQVHVKRIDGTFWNGYVVSIQRDGVYGFQERKLGNCLLFAADVRDVEECKSIKEQVK